MENNRQKLEANGKKILLILRIILIIGVIGLITLIFCIGVWCDSLIGSMIVANTTISVAIFLGVTTFVYFLVWLCHIGRFEINDLREVFKKVKIKRKIKKLENERE